MAPLGSLICKAKVTLDVNKKMKMIQISKQQGIKIVERDYAKLVEHAVTMGSKYHTTKESLRCLQSEHCLTPLFQLAMNNAINPMVV